MKDTEIVYRPCPDGVFGTDPKDCSTCEGLNFVPVEPNYEAAEIAYMKSTGSVMEKAIRTAVDAALGEPA